MGFLAISVPLLEHIKTSVGESEKRKGSDKARRAKKSIFESFFTCFRGK
jgi:hypothetical protein